MLFSLDTCETSAIAEVLLVATQNLHNYLAFSFSITNTSEAAFSRSLSLDQTYHSSNEPLFGLVQNSPDTIELLYPAQNVHLHY
jgi:hypothetical protein